LAWRVRIRTRFYKLGSEIKGGSNLRKEQLKRAKKKLGFLKRQNKFAGKITG